MGLRRTVAPTVVPISVDEAKSWAKIEVDNDNDIVTDLIDEAVQRCEEVSGLSLNTQTWVLTLDSFTDEQNGCRYDASIRGSGLIGTGLGSAIGWYVKLARPPVLSVTSLTYVDTSGTTQTLASSGYQVDTTDRPGRIIPAYGTVWPVVRGQLAAITITYQAGFGSNATDVPADIRGRLKEYVAYRYRYREESDFDFLTKLFEHFDYGVYR